MPSIAELQSQQLMSARKQSAAMAGGQESFRAVSQETLVAPTSDLTDRRTLADWMEVVVAVEPGVVVASEAAHGILADGTTDNASALNALFASGAKDIYLPPGVYNFGSQLTIPSYVRVRGAGLGATILRGTFATGNAIVLGTAATLEGVGVTHSGSRTAGYSVVMDGSNRATVRDCEFQNYFLAISMKGANAGSLIVGARILRCTFFNPKTGTGSGGIVVDFYSSCIIDDITMIGPSSTPWPDFGLRLGAGDTFFGDNSNISNHGQALLIDPDSGSGCYSPTFTNFVFDNAHNAGGTASAVVFAPGSTGAVRNARFTSCWFGFADAQGCRINPTGPVDGVEFVNCEFNDNGDSGIRVNGTNIKNWSVIGGSGAGNTTAAINISGGASYFRIEGFTAGDIASRGVNGKGITIQSGTSDYYIVTGNICVGNTTAQIEDAGTGTHKLVDFNQTGVAGFTDNAIIRADGTFGRRQNSGVTVGDDDRIVAPGGLQSRQLTVADDAATSFTVPGSAESFMLFLMSISNLAGMVTGRATSSVYTTKIGGGADLAVTTGALTGTTGADGKLTVSAHTDGKVYIENRMGLSLSFGVVLFAAG